MKLYLISQDVNNNYDTFDSAVVAAESEQEAREINPDRRYEIALSGEYWVDPYWDGRSDEESTCWASRPSEVSVKYLGEAAEGTQPGVILASFNAG